MYTVTSIYKKWKISKRLIQVILEDNNVTPIHTDTVSLHSMVYLTKVIVTAKYYDENVVNDLFKNIELRLDKK